MSTADGSADGGCWCPWFELPVFSCVASVFYLALTNLPLDGPSQDPRWHPFPTLQSAIPFIPFGPMPEETFVELPMYNSTGGFGAIKTPQSFPSQPIDGSWSVSLFCKGQPEYLAKTGTNTGFVTLAASFKAVRGN